MPTYYPNLPTTLPVSDLVNATIRSLIIAYMEEGFLSREEAEDTIALAVDDAFSDYIFDGGEF